MPYSRFDPSGTSLTYRLPVYDSKGDYVYPLVWDGIQRSMYVDGTNLMIQSGTSRRVLASGVLTTNPNEPFPSLTVQETIAVYHDGRDSATGDVPIGLRPGTLPGRHRVNRATEKRFD